MLAQVEKGTLLQSSAKKLAASPLSQWALAKTSFISQPLATKMREYGSPVLERIDISLSTIYCTVDGRVLKDPSGKKATSLLEVGKNVQLLIVESAWFKRVDAVFQTSIKPTVSYQTFVSAAERAYRTSHDSYEAFVAQLSKNLADATVQWDQKLVAPATAFYAAARENRALADGWEAYFASNARSLYNAAMDHYNSAVTTVSTHELVQSMKVKMGAAWNEKLRAPLQTFFDNAKRVQAESAQVTYGSAFGVLVRAWQKLYDASAFAVDVIMPADADEKLEPPHETRDKTLACTVSRRLRVRARRAWQGVRGLSGQAEPFVNVNVAVVAEDAAGKAVQKAEPLTKRVCLNVGRVYTSASELVSFSVNVVRSRYIVQLPRDTVAFLSQAVGASPQTDDYAEFRYKTLVLIDAMVRAVGGKGLVLAKPAKKADKEDGPVIELVEEQEQEQEQVEQVKQVEQVEKKKKNKGGKKKNKGKKPSAKPAAH